MLIDKYHLLVLKQQPSPNHNWSMLPASGFRKYLCCIPGSVSVNEKAKTNNHVITNRKYSTRSKANKQLD